MRIKILNQIYYFLLKNWRIKVIYEIINRLIIQSNNNKKTLILDIGSGDAIILNKLKKNNPNIKIIALDIFFIQGIQSNIKIVYDGMNFPFKKNVFDYILLIDVLHHIKNTDVFFENCVSLTRKYIIIKDHYNNNKIDEILLRIMDFLGNKFNGVNLPYNFLSSTYWDKLINKNKLIKIELKNNLKIYPRIFDCLLNRKMHFICLLSK